MPVVVSQLKPIAYRLLLLRLAAWVAFCLIGTGIAFGVLEMLEKLLIFKETTALALNLIILGIAGVVTVTGFIRVFKYQPKLQALSNRVEEAHPELMDSLNAAVEVANIPLAKRTTIERLLIESVAEKTASYNLEKLLIPRYLRFYALSGLFLVGFFLLGFAHFFDVSQKFRYQLGDWIRGESSAFYITPNPLEVARGEDLRVLISPRRWDAQCVIEFKENGEFVSFPMNSAGEGRSDFVFYDAIEDFQFWVQTNSLTSSWQTVLVYDPPVLDLFQLFIEPPAYSGYESESHDTLKDLELLEGTRLSFDLAGESISELSVEFGEDALPLQINDAGTFGFDIRAEESSSLRFVMFNKTGHRAQTETVQLKVLPDESPVIEWIEPGKDITVKPEDVVPLELFVADDFGLKAVILNISISGTRQKSIVMHAGEVDRESGAIELNLFDSLDLFELEVLDGDVISYSATAMDNKEPEPNIVRSEVFFIEIRVAKEPIELEGMDGEGETEEVDVRAMVIELKKIIRDTYAALGLPPDENQFANQEIGTQLASLRTVIEAVMVQAAPILTQQGQDHLMEFLIRAREGMEKAETMINSNATDLAIAPEEQALAELVSFEAELSRNQSKSESESQSESDGESQGQPPPEGEESKDPSEAPNFAELPETLDDLNSLIDRQSELNNEIERAQRRNATEEELKELAEQQSQMSKDAVEMRDQLERLMPGTPVAPAVDQAAGEMAQGAGQLEEGQPSLAQGSGQRAQQGLMNAATLLEQGINQVAAEMMEGLAGQGQQLASRQSQAADQSRQAEAGELNDEERAELKGQQEGISEDFEEWQERLGQTANQLREQFPEAASGLDSIAEQSEEENVEGQMSRAENALHYRRYGRAAPVQDELAQALDNLAEGIEESASQMPQLADSAVREALAELQEARQDLQGMQAEGETPEGQQRLEAMQGQISGMLSDLASRLDDPELQEFSGKLNMEDEDPKNWSGAVRATDEALGKAGQVLLKRLRSSIRELQLDMLRQSSNPPEQYRSQVEKYFEQLAEEGAGNS